MDMAKLVVIILTSATWRVPEGLWAKISRRHGLAQISWHPVLGRWVQQQGTIPWMISGTAGISGRLLDFVHHFLALIGMCTNMVSIIGPLFLKHFKEAVKMSVQQSDIFEQFLATFSPTIVNKWEAMWPPGMQTWRLWIHIRSDKVVRPYVLNKRWLATYFIEGTTLQDVCLLLEKEESEQVALGRLSWHKISLSAFLLIGFDLEDGQWV